MKTVLAAAVHPRDSYLYLTSLVVPRPIAWVTTTDGAGHTNLAPFSYFTGLGSDPPMVTIAISDRKDRPKDTLRIARETGALCINLVEEHDAERMNATAGDYAPDVSEAALLGIATVPCTAIAGVRVQSARAAFECKLVDVHRYGGRVQVNLAVCEIVCFHFDEALLDPANINPIARLGGPHYAKLGERFAIERPKV